METFITHLPYIGLAVILFMTGFGVPLPEDIPLIFAGYLCGQGKANIWIMLPVGVFSILASDFVVYALGRRYGHAVPKLPLLGRYLREDRLTRAAELFHRHGGKTLFIARFLPGVRTPTYFTAGVFKIPFWKMLVFDGLACMISAPTFMLLAYHFSDHIEQVRLAAARGKMVITIAIIVLALGYGLYWYLFKKRPQSSNPA